MAYEVVRSTRKSVKHHAWCGTIKDLERLARMMEEAQKRPAHRAPHHRPTSPERQSSSAPQGQPCFLDHPSPMSWDRNVRHLMGLDTQLDTQLDI